MSDQEEHDSEANEHDDQLDDATGRFAGFDEDTSNVEIPEELPILPLRGVVIFPSASIVAISRLELLQVTVLVIETPVPSLYLPSALIW